MEIFISLDPPEFHLTKINAMCSFKILDLLYLSLYSVISQMEIFLFCYGLIVHFDIWTTL